MSGFVLKWATAPDVVAAPSCEPTRAAEPIQTDLLPDEPAVELPHAQDVLDTEGVSWEQWRAVALNRIFHQQGARGQPGRITAATVRHGERLRGLRVVRRN
jgi:hypothetical protein